MNSYKDSGVPWFGKVPHHWDVLRLGALLKERGEVNRGRKTENILSVMRDVGVINYEDKGNVGNKKSEDIERYKIVREGDIVVNSMNVIIGSVGIAKENGALSPVYLVFRAADDSISTKYYNYIFMVKTFQRSLVRIGYGILDHRMRIPVTLLRQEPLPKPPREEQDAIVSFLDSKLADIDRYITEKERLIELLQEQKTAIINQAVTKGINSQVRMKDSGIEWLGEIPEHWEVMKLARLALLLQTGPFGSQLHQSDYIEGGRPSINPLHMINGRIVPDFATSIDEKAFERLQRHALKEGDVIFARRGEMGRCALVTSKEVGWLCGTGSLLMRPKENMINAGYLVLVFLHSKISEHLSLMSVGSTMENLNTGILARLDLPIPSLDEQQQIIDFIEKTSTEIGMAINRTYEEIDLVREYRTALIAEAVTGKIDVR